MARKCRLAGRPVYDHAGSYSFLLRTGRKPAIGIYGVDETLEIVSARCWPYREQAPIWQREAWDTQLRRQESYASKWEYVVNNPVRAGLTKRAEDWPYQGELNELRW